VGSSCGADSSGTSSATSYDIDFPNAAQPNLTIASMTLSTSRASTYCVNIYESSAFSTANPASVTATPNVTLKNVALNSDGTSFIIPYLTGNYDMSVQPACLGTNIYLNDKPYSTSQTIDPPTTIMP
jgi:hypothetical protein